MFSGSVNPANIATDAGEALKEYQAVSSKIEEGLEANKLTSLLGPDIAPIIIKVLSVGAALDVMPESIPDNAGDVKTLKNVVLRVRSCVHVGADGLIKSLVGCFKANMWVTEPVDLQKDTASKSNNIDTNTRNNNDNSRHGNNNNHHDNNNYYHYHYSNDGNDKNKHQYTKVLRSNFQ